MAKENTNMRADANLAARTGMEQSLLGDSPVLESERIDMLGFKATAGVLAGAAVETGDPLTIGIFGEWGSGKTSLMRLIMEYAQKRPNAAAVWFNAWQYEKEEHLIVPLVATINKELSSKETGWTGALKEGASRVGKALRSIAYGFSVKGKVGIPLISEAEVNLSGKDMIQRYQELTKDTLLSRSLYFDAFEELKACQAGNAGCEAGDGCEVPRIVVFVDDLDRCFPDKAVSLLEGIKLVLHQPGFSFVLGVNEKIIDAFIKTKYEKDFKIEGAYFDNYLDKIVQVKIPVPRREADGMRDYIVGLMAKITVFPRDIVNNAVFLIAEACRYNPRSVVRLLNRVMVTHRIGEAEGKVFDPLALLIHIATDEPHYEAFRKALDVNVVIQAKEGEQGRTVQIGQYLAEELKSAHTDHGGIAGRLREARVVSREIEWKSAVETIAQNEHLYNLLKSDKGIQWLGDSTLRHTLGEAAKSTMGEKKAEADRSSDFSGPIEALLMNMVKIPAGTFKMGGNAENWEQPIHDVTLQAFEIGAMQVTQDQYEAIMGLNPSRFKSSANPVENVSWHDAKDFCRKLSEKANRTFTLPSEAQWEYACRAGSTGNYCFGDDEKELGEYAWYEANSSRQTHPVGEKKPNKWGLYDMHGNVWEWCLDHWHENYNGAPNDGSAWETADEGTYRVIRGGSWDFGPRYCRSAYRYDRGPDGRDRDVGFRVLAVLEGNK